MNTKLFTILAVVLFSGNGLYAVPIDKIFTSDGVIREGDEYANVYIYDTPPHRTTVSMFGGRASGILAYDSSILNIAGGIAEVIALNQSAINISGGSVHTLAALDSSSVNVFGGSLYELYAWDTGTVNVFGSANIDILAAREYSVINVSDGTAERIGVLESGVINLSGGFISDGLGATDSGIINVYGYDLAKFSTGGHYGFGFVSGQWQTGIPFNIDLGSPDTYSRVILYEVPEPTTLLLVCSGSLFLRKRE